MSYTKKIFLLILFFLIILGVIMMTQMSLYSDQPLHVPSNDTFTRHQEHHLLSSAGEISSNSFKFAQKFLITNLQQEKIKVAEEEYFTYFINHNKTGTIEGQYIIDSNEKNGGKITLIILQGTKQAFVKVKGQNKWYSCLTVDYAPNATTTLPIEIKWDLESDEDLIMIPINNSHPEYYLNGSASVFRNLILNNKPEIPDRTIQKYIDIKNQIFQSKDADFSLIPSASWKDVNKHNVELRLNKQQGFIYSRKPIHTLNLTAISFDTKIDVICFSNEGKILFFQRGIPIKRNQETMITLPDTIVQQLNNGADRKFILLYNNQGINLLADWVGGTKINKPIPSSFQQVIEFYKTQP